MNFYFFGKLAEIINSQRQAMRNFAVRLSRREISSWMFIFSLHFNSTSRRWPKLLIYGGRQRVETVAGQLNLKLHRRCDSSRFKVELTKTLKLISYRLSWVVDEFHCNPYTAFHRIDSNVCIYVLWFLGVLIADRWVSRLVCGIKSAFVPVFVSALSSLVYGLFRFYKLRIIEILEAVCFNPLDVDDRKLQYQSVVGSSKLKRLIKIQKCLAISTRGGDVFFLFLLPFFLSLTLRVSGY